jgi:hypothetical protein
MNLIKKVILTKPFQLNYIQIIFLGIISIKMKKNKLNNSKNELNKE